MKEGGLGAPVRHAIAWRDPEFVDADAIDAELRRVFDVCHGCRRCFNLCDSFPRLFDLIDASESGELDAVASANFKPVVDACTLCDMCFMTKCPYVPPHEFDLDFPHLMVRHRAAEAATGGVGLIRRQLGETDRNGRLGCAASRLANWATRRTNRLARGLLEAVASVHRDADLPTYAPAPWTVAAAAPPLDRKAPAFGRKAVIYATCFANYNDPAIGDAARAVLARNGVETEIAYAGCCAMPQFEHGDLGRVADAARRVAADLVPWIERGYDVVSLVPSCTLMMKFEWPLMVPESAPEAAAVARLAVAVSEISEYVVDIARNEGLAHGLRPLDGTIAVHVACHARAQNMGRKTADMLALLPETEVTVIERCSGHGGSWGVMAAPRLSLGKTWKIVTITRG